jgi:outer membrane protein insertion porin family
MGENGVVMNPRKAGVRHSFCRMRLLALAVIAVIGVPSVHAQSKRTAKPKPAAEAPATSSGPPAEGAPFPLETLNVTGNQNFTAEQVKTAAQLRVGQAAGKAEFEAARARLMATGVFDRAGYRYAPSKDGKGYDATLEVVEMPQLYPLRFEDLPATDAQLRAWLKQKDPLFAPKIPATKPELDRYARLISEFLAQQNYHDAVAGKVTSEGVSDLVVVFRPAKAKPSVARVKFTNTGDISAVTLQTAMYGVAIGVPYTEPQIRLLLDTTIRPLYEARGMIRVSFPKIEAEPVKDKDVDGLEVTIEVNQGPVYKLSKVRFIGAEDSVEDLSKLAKLEADKPVNFDEVKAANEKIVHSMQRDGYMQAKSEIKRDVNDAQKTVAVIFQITPGPLFTFGELKIVGLDIETEPVIRKMWGLQPGRPFNVDYPNHFLDRVKEGGIFDNLKSTRSETKVNANNSVDVTLYFNK